MISYPFTAKLIDGEFDRVIDSATERAFNKQKWTNGIWAYPTDGMKIVPTFGMTVSANIGGCQIEGAQGYNPIDLSIPLDASNPTYGRVDRIVARFDLNDAVRSIDIYKKTGIASQYPIAEDVTTEPNYFELVLADIHVNAGATEITAADIKDQRLNSDLCGTVIPAIPTPIDTSSLFTQYQDALNQYLAIVAAAIDETLAGQLQTDIDANTASAAAALAQSDVALAAANGAQSDVDDLETVVSNISTSFANPTSIATALDSASGWTATGNGMLAIGGRATSTVGYYFLKDETVDGYILLLSMPISAYNGGTAPIIKGHVYKRVIGNLTTADMISSFFRFN